MRRPVLVTGVHRSGTTWVGRVIDMSPDVGYVNEPFNPTHQPGICACRFSYWYQYVHTGNASAFTPALFDTLRFRYAYAAQLRGVRGPADLHRLSVDAAHFLWYRVRRARPLLKDPIAAMSAGWLSTTFGAQVIVVVRHPAAVAHSLRRLNWWHPFGDFLRQAELIDQQLRELEPQIRRMAGGHHDILDEAALLWRIVYSVLLAQGSAHPQWLFVRQEDLARDPVLGFARVFDWLELEYPERIQRGVRWYSSGPDHGEPTAEVHQIRRHSEHTRHSWRGMLSAAEVARLRTIVEPLSSQLYTDQEW